VAENTLGGRKQSDDVEQRRKIPLFFHPRCYVTYSVTSHARPQLKCRSCAMYHCEWLIGIKKVDFGEGGGGIFPVELTTRLFKTAFHKYLSHLYNAL